MNFSLRNTLATTGHRQIFEGDSLVSSGFSHTDFDGCLDAPLFNASGSTRRFEYGEGKYHFDIPTIASSGGFFATRFTKRSF